MMFTRLLLVPALLSGCLAANANSNTSSFAEIQDSPVLAQSFDYCKWAFEDGGKTVSLPDYEAALDRETDKLAPNKWAATVLIDAGTRIARHASSQKACDKTFAKGTKSFDKQMKKSLASHWKQAKYKKSDSAEIAQVQSQLANHWVGDQSARRVYLASRTDDETGAKHWTRRLAVAQTNQMDTKSTEFMRGLLEEYDWIDRERFGDRVSMAAWLMMQHADDHVDLQALALGRMEAYLESGGVDKGNYAFLWDRVAVNSDRKQRYGTQPTWECTPDNKLTLKPLEDPENVNERRAAMGLDTVEEGLASMERSVCQ